MATAFPVGRIGCPRAESAVSATRRASRASPCRLPRPCATTSASPADTSPPNPARARKPAAPPHRAGPAPTGRTRYPTSCSMRWSPMSPPCRHRSRVGPLAWAMRARARACSGLPAAPPATSRRCRRSMARWSRCIPTSCCTTWARAWPTPSARATPWAPNGAPRRSPASASVPGPVNAWAGPVSFTMAAPIPCSMPSSGMAAKRRRRASASARWMGGNAARCSTTCADSDASPCCRSFEEPMTRHPILRWLACGFATGLLLTGCDRAPTQSQAPAASSAEAIASAEQEFIDRLYVAHIVPGTEAFAASSRALVVAAEDFCGARDATRFAALQAAWRSAALAWQPLRWLQAGPGADEHRMLRIDAWPQARLDLVATRVGQMLAAGQPVDADAIANQPVQVQGLPALETLLFEDRGPADFPADAMGDRRCALVVGIAGNLARIATTQHERWLRGAKGGNDANSVFASAG